MFDKSIEDTLKEVGSREDGLEQKTAENRLAEHGPNELKKKKPISPFMLFVNQFRSYVIYILLAALLISFLHHEYVDAGVIATIVIVNAILGFIQEFRAEKSIEALKKLSSLHAKVVRDGKEVEIDAKDLVVGDVVLLAEGDKVPADCRLLQSITLQTAEAPLTGESVPVKKQIDALSEKTPLAERTNMVYSGTVVVSGKGKAVVVATGMDTEIGKIATLIQEAKPQPTPLQRKLDKLGKILSIAVIAISVIVFVTEVFLEETARTLLLTGQWGAFFGASSEFFLFAIALAVAAIPEGLPAVVTITLALGTRRMISRNALIRKLPSVETLGSTTVICSDKTGTLTRNEMTVKRLFANGQVIEVTGSGYKAEGDFLVNNKKIDPKTVQLLLKIGALNNDAGFDKGKVLGDPTEAALLVSAKKAGFDVKELTKKLPRVDEIPFSSERKIMTTVHGKGGEKIAFVKGAPEMVLARCTSISVNGKVKPLTERMKKEILEHNKAFAKDALRVLGFACKTVMAKDRTEKNLTFVGLQAMMDPPRKEVRKSIQTCKEAGVRVIMITGDNEITAKAVGAEIGLEGDSITGADFASMSDAKQQEVVKKTNIFARVNPEHKIRIVEILQSQDQIVAMTGDGVNDAPALKKADIGVAMGITGTDVSKEAAAMILTDDNFSSIVNAVEEGRGIYGNIKKYFAFLISGNIGEVAIIFLGIIFGLPLPLTATQIFIINLVTDGLPALGLSADPFEPGAMKRKPRKVNESVFAGLNGYIIYYPIAMVIVALSVFVYFYGGVEENLLKAQTATFVTIALFELYQAYACRSTIYPSHKVGFFKNQWLNLAVLSSFVLVGLAVFVPAVAGLLGMVVLSQAEFFTIFALASIGAIVIETSKIIQHKKSLD